MPADQHPLGGMIGWVAPRPMRRPADGGMVEQFLGRNRMPPVIGSARPTLPRRWAIGMNDDSGELASPRGAMDEALKRVLVPELRRRGFTGSLPHFRRRESERISLLSIQHFSSGGSFTVEVAACPPSGHMTSWGQTIAPSKVRALDVNDPRPRLGSLSFPGSGDHWFVYGPRLYDPDAGAIQPSPHYEAVARSVLELVDSQAEPFWRATST